MGIFGNNYNATFGDAEDGPRVGTPKIHEWGYSVITATRLLAMQKMIHEWGPGKSTNGDFRPLSRANGREQRFFLRMEDIDAKNLRMEISHDELLQCELEKLINCSRRDCHTRPLTRTTRVVMSSGLHAEDREYKILAIRLLRDGRKRPPRRCASR